MPQAQGIGKTEDSSRLYESTREVESKLRAGVRFTLARMSFDRRLELLRQILGLAQQADFLKAGESAKEQIEATVVRSEIDRIHLLWGLRSVSGLWIDGREADPEQLLKSGPEELVREALSAIRCECGLSEEERKN